MAKHVYTGFSMIVAVLACHAFSSKIVNHYNLLQFWSHRSGERKKKTRKKKRSKNVVELEDIMKLTCLFYILSICHAVIVQACEPSHCVTFAQSPHSQGLRQKEQQRGWLDHVLHGGEWILVLPKL